MCDKAFDMLQFAIVLILSVAQLVDACNSEVLSALNGTVSCPSGSAHDSRYSPNLDSRWLLSHDGVKVIRFLKVDVESRYDNVLIFENTDAVESDRMRFRVNSADAVSSEFWLTGKTLVRFLTDKTVHRTGIKFSYEHKMNSSIIVPTEVIRQRSGYRFSHPGFSFRGYPNDLKLAWSIHVPNDSLLTVRISAFNTQHGRDFLTIHPGPVPNVGREVLHEFSGRQTIPELKFSESVTLVFKANGSSDVKAGFAFEFMVLESSACSEKINLTDKEGTVSSFSTQVKHEICWLINASGFVGINFNRLDINPCCDKVHVYANSEVPNTEKEVLQLSNLDAIDTEFWLTVSGMVLVRFKASQNSSIEFVYRSRRNSEESISPLPNLHQGLDMAVVERIKAESGSRQSVVGYRSFGIYTAPNDLAEIERLNPTIEASSTKAMYIWIISSRITDTVTIRFSNLSTKFQQGKLKVYSGPCHMQSESLSWNVFDGLATKIEDQFVGGATIVYETTMLAYHAGFEFEFIVGRKIQPLFQHWSGRFSLSNPMKILVSSSNPAATAQCLARPACGNRTLHPALMHSNQQHFKVLYSLSFSNSRSYDVCIASLRCTFVWPSGQPRRLESDVELAEPDPESIFLELMQPELSLVTGVARFLAKSEAACPSVSHRCQLRTIEGKIYPAQLLQKEISEPSEPQCVSSVTSILSVVARQASDIKGSIIECRLLSGQSARLEMPYYNTTDKTVSRDWLVPFMMTALVICFLAVITLSAFIYILFMRRRGQPGVEKSSMMRMNRRVIRGNQYVVAKHPASEIYLN